MVDPVLNYAEPWKVSRIPSPFAKWALGLTSVACLGLAFSVGLARVVRPPHFPNPDYSGYASLPHAAGVFALPLLVAGLGFAVAAVARQERAVIAGAAFVLDLTGFVLFAVWLFDHLPH